MISVFSLFRGKTPERLIPGFPSIYLRSMRFMRLLAWGCLAEVDSFRINRGP
jgi:hypothetical protein